MIVFNVTMNVSAEIAEDWESYMKATHIPAVIETGCFQSFKVLRLIGERPDADGPTYAVQYFAKNMKSLNLFVAQHDHSLDSKLVAKYGQKVVFFKTVLEEV